MTSISTWRLPRLSLGVLTVYACKGIRPHACTRETLVLVNEDEAPDRELSRH
jgi:hypothetical protein